jgi:hypothetical protein
MEEKVWRIEMTVVILPRVEVDPRASGRELHLGRRLTEVLVQGIREMA